MQDLHIWTVEDANAAIPRLRATLPKLRASLEEHRAAVERASLLAMESRDAARAPAHPQHAAYADAVRRAHHAKEAADAILDELAKLGIEVKDPATGLVDFPTMRGRDVVYLCWREGESEVTHWHPIVGGFGARKPLDPLVRASGR